MPTNTYVALDKVTVGTATSTITFSSINQGYTDLIVVCNLAISSGTGNSKIQFNSDTGSNYSETTVEGTGSSAVSSRYTSNTSIILEGSGFLSTAFQTVKTIQLMNYSNTTTNKTCLVRNGGASAGVDAIVGLWRNTGAITSFTISTTASTFVSGSTFSLYGIANVDNFAKATGGIVYDDANYWYHLFAASGTFTPKQSLTCDYLVVAGGGGGFQGGGGAGGLRCTVGATGGGGSLESPLSVTATAYTITVGAGGAAQSSGNNSVFSTITATAGGRGGKFDNSVTAATGGSGGGGGGSDSTGYSGAAGTANQGYTGGNGFAQSGVGPAGGGGGANSAGTNGTTSVAGNGGTGVTTGISGYSTTYAGGGGGGVYGSGTTGGTGGSSIGGNGGSGASPGTNAGSGLANTGSGGGGAGFGTSGAGGSGVVVIRYAK